MHGEMQATPSTVSDSPGGEVLIVCCVLPRPLTTSVTEVDPLCPPPDQPTVKKYVPLALEGVVTARVDATGDDKLAGLKLVPNPAGNPDALSATVPENPLKKFTDTV